MTAIAISWAGPTAIALVTGWFGYLFGARQEREKERRARNAKAAAELTAPLRELQRLLRRFGRVDLDKHEVAHAFLSLSAAFDNHGHRLPPGWRHLARSLRDAAGTAFGGASLVHIRPDVMQLDLGEPDAMWRDYADEYLEYAARCILEWGDSSQDRSKELMTYEAWLVRTGRQEQGGNNGRQVTSTPAA